MHRPDEVAMSTRRVVMTVAAVLAGTLGCESQESTATTTTHYSSTPPSRVAKVAHSSSKQRDVRTFFGHLRIDVPNYFNSRELGAATLAVVNDCYGSDDATAGPSKAAMCLCVADAARVNVRAGHRPLPLNATQRKKCSQYARNPKGASPYAHGLPIPTENIVAALVNCFGAVPADTPQAYGALICGCTIDGVVHKRKGLLDEEIHRCGLAATYNSTARTPLTKRQFAGLPGRDEIAVSERAPSSFRGLGYRSRRAQSDDNSNDDSDESEECDADCRAHARGYSDAEDLAEDLGLDEDEAHDMLSED